MLDAFGGLAGDMLLGGLLDLWRERDAEPRQAWRAELESLGLAPWSLSIEPATRRGLAATRVVFEVAPEHEHRHLPEILERIERSHLGPRARGMAIRTFERLAQAEARVHRIPVEHVHFHEVGAADAILDVCGVCSLLDRLDVSELVCGPLPAGSGTVACAHGVLPCPVPAVVELLTGFELLAGVGEGEMVTPTGAALLAALGRPCPPDLAYRVVAAGYGAGTRPESILRVTLAGSGAAAQSRDDVLVFETNLDDCPPTQLAWAVERLLEAGAVDVAQAPITMKKGRVGIALQVLVPPSRRDAVLECLFGETPTLGVRERRSSRVVLEREIVSVETTLGMAQVKVAGGTAYPEFEDCARIARAHDLPLRRVYEEVLDAWRRR